MGKVTAGILALLVLVAFSSSVLAGTVKDTSFEPSTGDSSGSWDAGTIGGSDGKTWAMVYTVGTSGYLDRVELMVAKYVVSSGSMSDLVLNVYSASSGTPSGSSLGTVSVGASSIGSWLHPSTNVIAYTEFDFATDIKVTVGDKLGLVLTTSETTNNYGWWAKTNNSFTAGKAYFLSGSTWSDSGIANYDSPFRTYVETSVVPLPSAAWLGLGMLGALAFSRITRRRKTA